MRLPGSPCPEPKLPIQRARSSSAQEKTQCEENLQQTTTLLVGGRRPISVTSQADYMTVLTLMRLGCNNLVVTSKNLVVQTSATLMTLPCSRSRKETRQRQGAKSPEETKMRPNGESPPQKAWTPNVRPRRLTMQSPPVGNSAVTMKSPSLASRGWILMLQGG